jgi:hypothetical protein
VRVVLSGRTVWSGLVVAVAAALALPARSQEAPEAAAEPSAGAPAEAIIEEAAAVTEPQAPPPACAVTTSYKKCAAACREMFPKKPRVETKDERLDRSRLAIHGWWAIGTGAALLVAGGVTGGVALHLNAELSDRCPGGACPPSAYGDLEERDRLAVSSTVLLGAGVAASAVGILIVALFARPPAGAEKPQARAALAPLAARGTLGAAWTWRF